MRILWDFYETTVGSVCSERSVSNTLPPPHPLKSSDSYIFPWLSSHLKVDKPNYIHVVSLAAEAKEAAYHAIYATIRKLSGKYSKLVISVEDKDGQAIPDLEGQKKGWVEHFWL